MSKIKIFNDPIYGLVSYPYEFIYELIDHPYFQRLRRIQQLGMSSIVYPGATHSRFHHALGALHLCDKLIINLKSKGVDITTEEHEATLIAILLHDVGHGPYSHALEGEIIAVHHEDLTLQIMRKLNEEFHGRLDMAIRIFTKGYPKAFLSEMISGQVDVDRMDYLSRDSFYTGVAEGIIGYDRIIKMMNVYEGALVIEQKGIHSIEKFLLSRHFMYHQVYMHKTALAADHMLKMFLKKYKEELKSSTPPTFESSLIRLINENITLDSDQQIEAFLNIDDSDVITLIKSCQNSSNRILQILSQGLLNRRIFGITQQGKPLEKTEIDAIIREGSIKCGIDERFFVKMLNFGSEGSAMYEAKDEIKILLKKPTRTVTFRAESRLNWDQGNESLFFATYPKEMLAKQ